MTIGRTASTHTTESLEKLTFGKRYWVVDDQKHVWGADLAYEDAVKLKERVAGNLWSKTPTIKEMPRSAELSRKICGMVRGPDNVAPPPPAREPAPTAAPQSVADLVASAQSAQHDQAEADEVADLESAHPATNGSVDELDEDDGDLESLLNS